MARNRDDRRARRSQRAQDFAANNQQSAGQQYYQQNGQYYQQNGQYYQNPNGQYYQDPNGQYYQDPNGQYYQNPNGQYYQDPNGQYYQQGAAGAAGAGQYYQGNGQYYQNPNGQYYQDPNAQYYQQQAYGAAATAAAGSRKAKKPKKKRRVGLFIFELFLLVILAGALYVGAQVTRVVTKVELVELPEKKIQEAVKKQIAEPVVKKLEGYRNIAFFGVDSRDGDEDRALSDTIMICSINKDTKEVRLASVYRDTMLNNANGSYSKANEPYLVGGPERAISMLNMNLDLDISEFVTVNMEVLADVVDAVGGVEIYVRDEEVVHLNNYQVEGSEITHRDIIPVEGEGEHLLNGLQAVSYCRIRYIGLDYERTERQRKVLDKILEKVKKMDVIQLTSLVNTILPYVKTSLSATEILGLAKDVTSYNLTDTTGFPFEKATGDIPSVGDAVIPLNLAQNDKELHKFLFDNEEYEPSATVQEIANDIVVLTGMQ